MITFPGHGGGERTRAASRAPAPSRLRVVRLRLPSQRRIRRGGGEGRHFPPLGEPGVDLPPRQLGLRPQAVQVFVRRGAGLLEAFLQHHQLLRGLFFKLLQSEIWEGIPGFHPRLPLLHGGSSRRKWGRGGLVARVNNDGVARVAVEDAAPPAAPLVETDDVAVLGVALIVSGVAEPLLDLPFGQVGELHQPGDFRVGYEMVFQVAGFQLRQLLFGLFRPQAERIGAESGVLLRRERKQGRWVKRAAGADAEHRSERKNEKAPTKKKLLPACGEREGGWMVVARFSSLFVWVGWLGALLALWDWLGSPATVRVMGLVTGRFPPGPTCGDKAELDVQVTRRDAGTRRVLVRTLNQPVSEPPAGWKI